jgi:hypothetical protein
MARFISKNGVRKAIFSRERNAAAKVSACGKIDFLKLR